MNPEHVTDRHLDEPVRELDLISEAAALLQAANGGHVAKTLAKQGALRVVLLALARGARIPQHHAAVPISVQLLSGKVRFTVAEQALDLTQGRTLVVAAGLPHDLEAAEDSAVLLTLAG